ncbi:hypothetical protein D3C80_1500530 [compost metagenome]
MHQHPVAVLRPQFAQALQTTQHRIRALAPALGAGDARILRASQARPVGIIGRQTDHQAVQLRVIEKAGQAVLQNGLAGQLQVLLGPVGPHAAANPGGGDQSPEMR